MEEKENGVKGRTHWGKLESLARVQDVTQHMHSRGQVSLSARVSMTGFAYLYERRQFVADAKIFKFRQLVFNCFWRGQGVIESSCPQRSQKKQQDIVRRMESSPST